MSSRFTEVRKSIRTMRRTKALSIFLLAGIWFMEKMKYGIFWVSCVFLLIPLTVCFSPLTRLLNMSLPE